MNNNLKENINKIKGQLNDIIKNNIVMNCL